MKLPTLRTLAAIPIAAAVLLIALAVSANGTPDRAHTARQHNTRRLRQVSRPLGYSVDIQAIFDAAGNPQLVANFSPDGGLAKPQWLECRPPEISVCTRAGNSQFLNAGPTAAGTVFQASATYQGKTYTARTSPWQGAVDATGAPHVNGAPRYPASITASGATWTGGWGTEFDQLSIEACRTRTARHCVNLSPQAGYGYSTRPVHPGTWFDGWYLFAFDQRLAQDTAFAQPGYLTAAVIPTLRAGPTTARSAPSGPITGPPPPRIRFPPIATIHSGKVLVAVVHCFARCRVFVRVFDKHLGVTGETTLTGSRLVGVPRKLLHPGRLGVSLYVDDGPFVFGKTRLR